MGSDPSPRAVLGDRSLFPELQWRVYANHAAISPLSQPVEAEVADLARRYARQGLNAFFPEIERRDGLRARLAALVGAEATEIGLVSNTSTGLLQLAFAQPWRPRQRILLFEGEFPANVLPWLQAARAFDLDAVLLPLSGFGDGSGDGLARLEAELKRGAALVACSAVQFQTGLAMPLGAIGALCRQHGARFAVDAIQALGAMPLDVGALGIDLLSCGSHKWLMGPEGCGFIYARAGLGLDPRLTGWLGVEGALGFLTQGPGLLRYDRPLRQDAAWAEIGAANALGLAGLDRSLALLEQVGPILPHLQAWHDALEPGLLDRGFVSLRAADPAARSGILAVEPPPDAEPPALLAALEAGGIAASYPDGRVRFAPHWPNALDEAPLILAALDARP